MAAKAHPLKQTTVKFRNRRHLVRPVHKPTLSALPVEAVEVVEISEQTPLITPELKEELSPTPRPVPARFKARQKRRAILQPVPAPSDSNFLKQLALDLGIQAQRLNIFSSPVDREHITVIPVSQVFYGFTGENIARNKPIDPWGAGALHASPLGYIEIKDGRSQFRKIPSRGLGPLLPILLKGGSFFLLILRRLYENYLRKQK